MNRTGLDQPDNRSVTGGYYPTQTNNNIRSTSMQSQRLQHGKIAGAPGWGSGMPLGSAPGFSNPPARAGGMPNFAQAIGGQSQQALDLSEFPSLSGGPQAQGTNAMPQAWNGNTLRQGAAPSPAGAQRPAVQHDAPRPQQLSGEFGFSGGLDDGFSSRAGAPPARPETNRASGPDDFPPLGGMMNVERPGEMLSGTSNPSNALFGSQTSGKIGGEAFRAEVQRSDLDSHRSATTTQKLPFREANPAAARTPAPASLPQQSSLSSDMPSQTNGSPAPPPSDTRSHVTDMSDADKYGLAGLLASLPGRSEGTRALVMGHDLSSLGIDFDSTEPLFPTFSTPFHDGGGASTSTTTAAGANGSNSGTIGGRSTTAIPDFTLPAAYTVSNVPPLHSRVASFSDDTLFAIFYQFTRDVLQEVAAAELYSRDWRWHKELRQWMMKDSSMAQPIRITERSERGIYVFFDAMGWRRERREFVLNYDHLDQRHSSAQTSAASGP